MDSNNMNCHNNTRMIASCDRVENDELDDYMMI